MMKKQEKTDTSAPPRRGAPAIPELNEVNVIGRLINDPMLMEVKGGAKRASFMLTVPMSYVNGDGARVPDTSYVPVVGWRAIAKQCEDLRKGDTVQVDGRLKTWKSKDEKYHWEVEARLFQVLDKAEGADAPAEQREPATAAA